MDDVDPGGVADMAGIRKGDFLLEVNKHTRPLDHNVAKSFRKSPYSFIIFKYQHIFVRYCSSKRI